MNSKQEWIVEVTTHPDHSGAIGLHYIRTITTISASEAERIIRSEAWPFGIQNLSVRSMDQEFRELQWEVTESSF